MSEASTDVNDKLGWQPDERPAAAGEVLPSPSATTDPGCHSSIVREDDQPIPHASPPAPSSSNPDAAAGRSDSSNLISEQAAQCEDQCPSAMTGEVVARMGIEKGADSSDISMDHEATHSDRQCPSESADEVIARIENNWIDQDWDSHSSMNTEEAALFEYRSPSVLTAEVFARFSIDQWIDYGGSNSNS